MLDARPRVAYDARPTSRSANIPLHELRQRPYELPPAGCDVRVADTGPESAEAAELLAQMGRRPHLVDALHVEPTEDRFRLWRASSLLDAAEPMSPGCALCLACGVGREAVVLAARGWRVTAIDILPDAIERGRRLERAYLVADSPSIRWLCADLRRPWPDDLGEFGLVTQLFFADAGAVGNVPAHLTPGGVALLEAFTEQHWRALGRAKPNRLLPQAWPPLCQVSRSEGWHEGRHTTRVVVRKPDHQPVLDD